MLSYDQASGVLTNSQTVLLPAASAAQATGYPRGAQKQIIGAGRTQPHCPQGVQLGPLTNCDVSASFPLNWDDVTFQLRGLIGDTWRELDKTTMPDAEGMMETANGRVGMLFEWRGDPVDAFQVVAFSTTVNHAGADRGRMIMRVWGTESGPHQVEPYALNRNEWNNNLQTPDATAVVAKAAPTSGRRNLIMSLEISHNNALPQELFLQTQIGAAAAVTLRRWFVGPNQVFVQSYTKPLRCPLNAALQVVGAAGVLVDWNLNGFES